MSHNAPYLLACREQQSLVAALLHSFLPIKMCGLRKFSMEHFHYSRAIRFATSALDFPHGLQTE